VKDDLSILIDEIAIGPDIGMVSAPH
jgi:hypothetical protein